MIALILGLALANAPACTKGSEFEPPLCPSRLPRIAAVTIQRTGARFYPETDGQPPCTRFRPSRAQIVHYLAIARTTDSQSAHATLDRSACYASGSVRYVDGQIGQWTIEQLGAGLLTMPSHEPILLYCKECTAPPFAH